MNAGSQLDSTDIQRNRGCNPYGCRRRLRFILRQGKAQRIRVARIHLDKSRTLHLEAIQWGKIYTGRVEFGNLGTSVGTALKTLRGWNLVRRSGTLLPRKCIAKRIICAWHILYFFKILLFFLKSEETLEMMEFWKTDTQHFIQRLTILEEGHE